MMALFENESPYIYGRKVLFNTKYFLCGRCPFIKNNKCSVKTPEYPEFPFLCYAVLALNKVETCSLLEIKYVSI